MDKVKISITTLERWNRYLLKDIDTVEKARLEIQGIILRARKQTHKGK